MIKKYALILCLGLALYSSNLQAQESMMSEISYVLLEKLIATAKENYPRMNSFKSRQAIAKSNITSQKSAWLDGLSFSYIYQPNNTLTNIANPSFFNGYQVAISFSVNSLFQKSGAVREAKETLKLVQYEEDEYNLTIEAEVKRRYFSYVQTLSALRLQTKIAGDMLNISKDFKTRYEKSEILFSDYTQSQTAYSGALQAKIVAEANFLNSKASLEELLTKKIEEVQ